MLKILEIKMNCEKQKLNKLIEKYELEDEMVLKQSEKLDKLISKYYYFMAR